MFRSLARPVASCVVLLALSSMATKAQAAPIFNVTDLTTDPVNYTWDKYPVNYATPKIVFGWAPQSILPAQYYSVDSQGNYSSDIPVASNKFGSISYQIDHPAGSNYASGIFYGAGGYIWFANNTTSPVVDFNIHGQAVGSTDDGNLAMSTTTPSLPDSVLDHDISAQLGIHLTKALQVDDFGRIIAEGTIDGRTDKFLLTPVGLSAPAPAPEPSTIVVMAVGAVALGLRRLMRKEAAR